MKSKDTDFAYAASKVRALTNRLFPLEKLMQMTQQESAEIVNIMRQAGYTGVTPTEMLQKEKEKTRHLAQSFVPKVPEFTSFWVKEDYFNIKLFLRQEFFAMTVIDLSPAVGRLTPSALRQSIRQRDFSLLPETMARAIRKALEVMEKTKNPQRVDMILDRAAYTEMLELCAGCGNPFALELVRQMIDLANLRTFFRVKRMKNSSELFQHAFISGGIIPHSAFIRNEALKYEPYRRLTEYTESLTALEKESEGFIIRYLRKARQKSFGEAPVLAYLLAKKHEIVQLHRIFSGKESGMPPQLIQERLCEAYV